MHLKEVSMALGTIILLFFHINDNENKIIAFTYRRKLFLILHIKKFL